MTQSHCKSVINQIMFYTVCRVVHIKQTLLSIEKRRVLCPSRGGGGGVVGGSGGGGGYGGWGWLW